MVELLTIDGEEFEIMCITPDLYEESEELFMYVFPNFGNMCLCTNLKEAPEAMEELRKLMLAVLNDGISFAARHRATDQLVGICCNKIINVKKNISLQTVVESFKSQPMLTIIENVLRLEDGFDIFKEWQVDCAFEVEFLAIHPDWCNRGLGYSICCYVMQFAQAMARGELTPQQMAPLSVEIREERPELVMGILTSLYAEKLGSKLKCMCVNIAAVSGLDADGNIVDPEHENLRFAARRL
ncbi:uncharacterized protein LOC115624186 isoform X2 [Scaptodrosophila lebanonensis]|uniref:Uncharacterized protein LOC115624186 isoform X2 n=1 Tax=Drosophila lebanonensis TaxID=7225 RepID=A0A6J2THP7_DROLE|nr:uncharacterized protein LOC115624186 isoform X2 [Scaptodrosophila lebanonensis]